MKQIFVKKLARLSICACGFPALHTEINLGKEYKIPRYNAVGLSDSWTCGGCGKTTEIHMIMVLNTDGTVGWLPMELFDWDEAPEILVTHLKEESQGTADPSGVS